MRTARTINEFKIALQRDTSCGAEGEHGAIAVWRGEDARWHGIFASYGRIRQRETFESKDRVWPWLEVWLPQCHFLVM